MGHPPLHFAKTTMLRLMHWVDKYLVGSESRHRSCASITMHQSLFTCVEPTLGRFSLEAKTVRGTSSTDSFSLDRHFGDGFAKEWQGQVL
jgi:hypothetical protein